MATRNGLANTVTPRSGVASPGTVHFRNAGLASVWEWGDSADSGEPAGIPVACDTDSWIGVTAEASLLADSVLVVHGAWITPADVAAVVTEVVGVVCEQRLVIYEVRDFESDCDLQALAISGRDVLADERLAVSNALLSGSDVSAEVAHPVAQRADISLRCNALWTVFGDVLIFVPNPTLLTADTSVATCRAVSDKADQSIVVSGFSERLGDCLQSVSGGVQRNSDIRIVAGQKSRLEADQAWRIRNAHVSGGDISFAVSCLVALASDLEIRMATRLAPDADTRQTVFALVLHESHIIEV